MLTLATGLLPSKKTVNRHFFNCKVEQYYQYAKFHFGHTNILSLL